MSSPPLSRRQSLGVQLTGYLSKPGRWSHSLKSRFYVLTHQNLHYFKRLKENGNSKGPANSLLFGQERGSFSLRSITNLRVNTDNPCAFTFKSAVTGKEHTLIAESEDECQKWAKGVKEAILDLQFQPKKDRRYTTSGDFRNKQKYWPRISSLQVGTPVPDKPLHTVKHNVAWGERVRLSPEQLTPKTTIMVKLKNKSVMLVDHEAITRAKRSIFGTDNPPRASTLPRRKASADDGDGDSNEGDEFEDVFMVSPDLRPGQKPNPIAKQYQIRVRWEYGREPSYQPKWYTIPLPVAIIVLTSWILGNAHEFHGRLSVWTLTVLLASTILLQNLRFMWMGIEQPVWWFTLVQWQRAPDVSEAGDVPRRFVNAEKGNVQKAMARYKETLKWRKDENIDSMLETPHPKYELIKANYPHFFHKHCKAGHPVYYERPGGIDLKELEASGVTLEDLLWHYTYITEYLWTRIEPDDMGKVMTVLDVKGIGFRDAGGLVMEFIKKASNVQKAHYPERSFVIFIINVPGWFNIVWKLVRPMLDPATRAKVNIFKSHYQDKLKEFIDEDQLPVEYGGMCACGSATTSDDGASCPQKPGGCLVNSPQELELLAHVRSHMQKKGPPKAGEGANAGSSNGSGVNGGKRSSGGKPGSERAVVSV